MRARSGLLAISLLLCVSVATYYLFAWKSGAQRNAASLSYEGSGHLPRGASEKAELESTKATGPSTRNSQWLAAYSCSDCDQDALAENPFVAESEAEAGWMKQNAFPSVELRQWTDQATLAEVEQRALSENSDMWSLELIRKRCAVGDSRACVADEFGRALLLSERGLVYADYVLAESQLSLAESGDSAVSPGVASWFRAKAPEAVFSAALRGDGKAKFHLEALTKQLNRPWTAEELQKAAFSAISRQEIDKAIASARGQVPRQWAPRPTRAFASTVQGLMNYEQQARAAHADSNLRQNEQ